MVASGCPEVDVAVYCSKGTYIRSLAEDLGEHLGCGAHVIRLHRLAAGPFNAENGVTFEHLRKERAEREPKTLDHHLLPVDAPVASLPSLTITEDMGVYFQQGQAVMNLEAYHSVKEGGMVRVCLDGGRFLGLGELFEGIIVPKRVVNVDYTV